MSFDVDGAYATVLDNQEILLSGFNVMQKANGMFVGASGGSSSYGLVASGGIGMSLDTVQKNDVPHAPVTIHAPQGSTRLEYFIQHGRIIGKFLDESGNEISRFAVG